MMTPKWHWTKQQNAEQIKDKMIKSKLGVHSSISTEFKKGRTNQFKVKKLPKHMADAAAEGRRKSGMYENKKKHNGDFGKGHTPWNKGKKGVMPIPWNKGTRGLMPEPPNKGQGLGTPLNHLIRRDVKYKEWREVVFKRDNWTCIFCKQVGKKIHADHIKPFALICKENNIKSLEDALKCKELWDLKNGRTLCLSCHRKTDTYSGKYQTNLHKYPRKVALLKTK